MPAGTIKAIETKYKGYRMRSRSEARFAVFLDALNVRWEYELETFDLGKPGWYLPDFWLPDLRAWIEIKGPEPTFEEQQKARALAIQSENPVFIFYGTMTVPTSGEGRFYRAADGFRALGYGAIKNAAWSRLPYPNYSFLWVECKTCHAVDVIGVGPTLEVTKTICSCDKAHVTPMGERLGRAYEAARSARFEFGESGAPQ